MRKNSLRAAGVFALIGYGCRRAHPRCSSSWFGDLRPGHPKRGRPSARSPTCGSRCGVDCCGDILCGEPPAQPVELTHYLGVLTLVKVYGGSKRHGLEGGTLLRPVALAPPADLSSGALGLGRTVPCLPGLAATATESWRSQSSA